MSSDVREPIRPSADFWQRSDVIEALSAQDIGTLFRLIRRHSGASQTRIGIAIGMSQADVSRIMRSGPGKRQVGTHAVLARIADGLDMPNQARSYLGLAERPPTNIDTVPSHASLTAVSLTDPATTAPLPAHTATTLIHDTDWPMWFGMKVANAVSVIHGSTAEHSEILQSLLHQEILMFDASVPQTKPLAFEASRRQALITLATLPLAVGGLCSFHENDTAIERFLPHCGASLTACWHLLKGSDLDTVDRLLSGYLMQLEVLARRPSRYQAVAARLASQGHRISGIIALHRNHIRARELHCKQAVEYAARADDVPSQVSALISLASTYFYESDPVAAAATYENALLFDADMSPLQRSRTRAELSVVYGQLGRERQALESAELAEQLYPATPEHDPSYLYAEFTRASLTLEQGLAYAALAQHRPERGYQQRAATIFARVERAGHATIPDRIRYEIVNHQASTAVLLGDLDAFECYVARGAQGALLLDSKQRQKEVLAAWRLANEAWPREPRLKMIGRDLMAALTTR